MAEPSVVLFWGDAEFPLRLAAHDLLAAQGVQAREVEGSGWQGGETHDLATPSLWGERRALLVTQCQSLPEAGAQELATYVGSPSPDALCVLTLVTRGKNPPALAKRVQAGGGAVRQVAIRRQDLPKWLMERAKVRGMRLTGPAAATLVAVLGEDPGGLDQALEQLAAAFGGQAIGPEHVRSQFEGLGDQQVWDLCDRAFSGRLSEALVSLRALLEGRQDPLLILGGVASRLRDLLRVRALPPRGSNADAARAAGLRFEWQFRRYREQAERFTPEELRGLLERVAEADRALKAGVAGDVALTGLVAAMAGHPEATLVLPAHFGR
jgi:DNA polymerase III subunit delta